MCDQVRTDSVGRSWIETARYPIGSHGNHLTTVFRDKEDAEAKLVQWEQYGKEFEESRIEMNKRFPKLAETIIHQVNYRIQSRDVTDWK